MEGTSETGNEQSRRSARAVLRRIFGAVEPGLGYRLWDGSEGAIGAPDGSFTMVIRDRDTFRETFGTSNTKVLAEAFIDKGVPLVASVAWSSNKLTGAIKSTNGHLLVIGGFDGHGNVIAYDPAHDTDAEVRQVYDREEFERAWIPASGGIVYVIRPAGHATPSLTANNS